MGDGKSRPVLSGGLFCHKDVCIQHIFSSLGKGAGRAWGLACTLLLFLLILTPTAKAAAPGTVIANTAQASYRVWGSDTLVSSAPVTLVTDWMRTAAQVELLQYAPAVSGAEQVNVPLTSFDPDGQGGNMPQQIASVFPAGGTSPIDLVQPVPLVTASIYHQGEPVFFRVTDPDQNIDPDTVQTVYVLASTASSNDSELLLLSETGPDTGVFTGYIQSGGLGPVQTNNGLLDVTAGEQLNVQYTDAADSSDAAAATALVDPFGRVFDSATGQPVDNVRLSLVQAASGLAATVFGDDGASSFPSEIYSGGTFTDSSGKVYAFAAGEYRFPFVPPGTYRLVATAPSGYAAPSTVAESILQTLPGAPFVIVAPGSRGEVFTLNPGPTVRMDIPVDPTGTGLWLRKTVNRDVAAVGDFVQYTISIENASGNAAAGITLTDQLPVGLRFRSGSVRIDGQAGVDPRIGSHGRNLTFELGVLPDGDSLEVHYVAEITANARPGKAVNRAQASGQGGLRSNQAHAVLTVKEELYRRENFIAGRVIADNCNDDPTDRADGVAGVRIYLEDGTYVVTDEEGMYHFEGVSSGTHMVQLDLASIPANFEISVCGENSRQTGTAFSRFVDLHGGALWREDFHVRTKAPPAGQAELKMACRLEDLIVQYQSDLSVRSVAIKNARLAIILPEGSRYVTGSTRMTSNNSMTPQQMGNVLIYRLGDLAADLTLNLAFAIELTDAAQPGQLHTQAVLTFNSPAHANQRTQMINTVLALERRKIRQVQPAIVVHPQFDVLSAELAPGDRRMLDQLVDKLKALQIDHVVVTGHTDSRRIRSDRRNLYPDNLTLSLARARTVARYLADRLNLSDQQMTLAGKGADEPLADNATEQGRAKNRRVEVKVMSSKIEWVHDTSAIVCEDQTVSRTQGVVEAVADVAPPSSTDAPPTQGFEDIQIEALSPGFTWLRPAADQYPHIPSIKVAVQHGPQDRIILLLNGREVHALTREGELTNANRTISISLWSGISIDVGDNLFTAVRMNQEGKEIDRLERSIHYSGPPVKAQLVEDASRLVANGKDAPVVAIRLTDKDGYPARFGTFGELSVLPPYAAFSEQKALNDELNHAAQQSTRYQVERDGMIRIRLQPTVQSGYAALRFPFANKDQDIKVWLQPELRDWILVGLAEGTMGYNTVSGSMESLEAAEAEEDFYQDGRLAFFAKGRIKGHWLLTMAYDSGRETKDGQKKLFQTIDPDAYYTLYGDATQQQYEAASIRKLYLKIEREQFYALFGDYDTGLTVTELSRYSRRFSGIKTAYQDQRFGFNAFAADTDQAFVKDEIRGDGTSGLYKLSRTGIELNSEKVTIETRDRFHSESIVTSKVLTRHIDYNIDYDAGTLLFKSPVYSRDENFNPTYIVVDYESGDSGNASYTFGGRGSAKLAGGRGDVGATYIHEGPRQAEGDLAGVDAKLDLGRGLQIRAEAAATRREEGGNTISGQGYLAEVSKQSADLDTRLYFREQGKGFGLGQQNGSEAETRKIGAEAIYRLKDRWNFSGEFYRQYNLATDAERDLAEARVAFNRSAYNLFAGLRLAEDRLGGQTDTSSQLLLGGARQFMDNRLQARLTHEQSIAGNSGSVDFPTRTIFGADFKVIEPIALYAEHEITQGEKEDTQSSRLGVKATPWSGGQIGSSVGRHYSENGQRVFATLGLVQTWRINDRWSIDGGLDRTQTVRHAQSAPFDVDVPTAAGAEEDFTAVSLGAGYKAELWSWNARLENRTSDSQDKLSLISGIAGEVRKGLGLSAGLQFFTTRTEAGTDTQKGDVRLSAAFRPKNARWIVLERLDYKFENQKNAQGHHQARRIVNNLNANYKPQQRLQFSLQYGAKFVFDTIDGESYTGYTDLTGLEARYDLTDRWDLGLHAGIMHSWNAGQMDYCTGLSMGYAVVKNMWVSLGYNFSGFKDQDFSAADYTAAGPYAKFRIKIDQQSVREMVNWFAH